MSIHRILLDLDGVCNRLIMHVLEFHGCGVSRWDNSAWPLPGCYDIVAAANELLADDKQLSADQFWECIPQEIWASSPISDEYHWLLAQCFGLVGESNVCFVTAPTRHPESLAGKLEWIHRFTPLHMHRQFLVGPAKHFCARNDALLIDDSDANVNAFRDHGGQALLVPRPWNSAYREDTWITLRNFFTPATAATALQERYAGIGLIPRLAV